MHTLHAICFVKENIFTHLKLSKNWDFPTAFYSFIFHFFSIEYIYWDNSRSNAWTKKLNLFKQEITLKKTKLVLWTEFDAAFNSDSGHAGKVLALRPLVSVVCLVRPWKVSCGIPGRKIRLTESNTKCRHLKKSTNKDFAAGACLSEAPTPPRFLFGVV
jgi:hypothetical protein